jgi:hypothetical protein
VWTGIEFSLLTFQILFSPITQIFSVVCLEFRRGLSNVPQINNNNFFAIESGEMEKKNQAAQDLYVANVP